MLNLNFNAKLWSNAHLLYAFYVSQMEILVVIDF